MAKESMMRLWSFPVKWRTAGFELSRSAVLIRYSSGSTPYHSKASIIAFVWESLLELWCIWSDVTIMYWRHQKSGPLIKKGVWCTWPARKLPHSFQCLSRLLHAAKWTIANHTYDLQQSVALIIATLHLHFLVVTKHRLANTRWR